jgi:MFS family permease
MKSRGLRASDGVLWLLCAMYFLLYIDRVNISTAATSIQADLHLSNTELGLAFSAFAYPYAFFQIFGGWIGDRLGPRSTLAACGLIVAATTMATGAAGGLASLFVVRLLLGFGEGAAFPTATRAMARWLPPARWGYAQGITHSASRLGNAITPPLISALILAWSWRGSFIAVGAASLLWVIAWTWFFRDDPRTHPRISSEELSEIPAPAGPAPTEPTPWRELIRRVLPATLVDFCYGWMLWLFLNWLPSFFQVTYHLNLKSSAVFASGVFFAGVVGDTLGGIVSDRVLRVTGSVRAARCLVIAGGLLGAFIFLVPLLFTRDLTRVAICLGLAFFCLEFVVAPIWSVPMDIAPDHAGKASGLMNLGFGIAGVVSPFVVGVIIDATGSRTLPFVISMVLLLCGAVMTLWVRPDRPLRR